VSEHFKDHSHFDWTRLDTRARVYELPIIQRDFTNDICRRQRKEQFEAENQFERMWKGLRPKLEEVLTSDPSKRPTTFHQAVEIATGDGGVLWSIGRNLYHYVTDAELIEPEIRSFMDICPPFRGVCYGPVRGWYDGAIRPDRHVPTPGRNDLMMAGYLPYCGRFVTDDWPQEQDLRQIATEADIHCEVLSLEALTSSLLITV
jgi:hypothetical protein